MCLLPRTHGGTRKKGWWQNHLCSVPLLRHTVENLENKPQIYFEKKIQIPFPGHRRATPSPPGAIVAPRPPLLSGRYCSQAAVAPRPPVARCFEASAAPRPPLLPGHHRSGVTAIFCFQEVTAATGRPLQDSLLCHRSHNNVAPFLLLPGRHRYAAPGPPQRRFLGSRSLVRPLMLTGEDEEGLACC